NSSATVTNEGTIDANGGGTITISAATVQNGTTGLFEAQNGGTLLVSGSLSNFASGVLTGGTYEAGNNGIIRGCSSSITTDAANVVLNGTGSSFYVGASGTTDALAGLVIIAASGSFSVEGGRTFTASSSLSNAGNVLVGSGSTFTETGTYS